MSIRAISVSVLAIAALAGTANAQFFSNGNLVVTRLGDGIATLGSTAALNTLVEFNRSGVATGQSVALNGSLVGVRLTNSGSATSEGALTGSTDRRYLSTAGYDATAATASVSSSANPTTARVVGVIDTWTGTTNYVSFTSATPATSAYSGNNIRSSIVDGNNVYMSGTSTTSGGVRLGTLSGGTSAIQSGTLTNSRVVNIADFGSGNILFASSSSGAFVGINIITGSGATNLITNAMLRNSGAGTASPYDYFFADDRTVYVADDTASGTGGLIKLARTGGLAGDVTTGTWAFGYSTLVSTVTGGNAGLRGLAGELVGNQVNLFGITTDNRLVSYTEVLSAALPSSFTTLASGGTNFAFRGVEIVPTPGAAALLGLAGLVAFRRRR